MRKINWAEKLSSRKFWAYLIGIISSLLFVFGIAETEVAQIAGIISAFGTMAIYLLTEGKVDVERAKASNPQQENILN